MSIISGKQIVEAINSGDITISPYFEKYVNPISYDLRLGEKYAFYANCVNYINKAEENFTPTGYILDCKKEEPIVIQDIPESGLVMVPGIGYLMHTLESVSTEKYVPILDGKSSVGRLFIQIHSTAGLGDPGFSGQFTLEVMVTHKIRVYKGMRIGQVRFFEISGEHENYQNTGHYNGVNAIGPVASQLWRSFNE